MWESEKLFVRKAFSEVMAAEKKIRRTVRFMQKSCLIEADQNCLFCQRPQKKKKKKETKGGEITKKCEQISNIKYFECLDVPLF